MFSRLVVERTVKVEEEIMKEYARKIGLEIVETNYRKLANNHFVVKRTDLVVGSVPFMHQAFRQLGIEKPVDEPYPEAIRYMLHRKVQYVSKLSVVKKIIEEHGELFVKPLITKRFTGFVTMDPHDYRFQGAGANTPCVISDPISFGSEFRCFVVNKHLEQIVRTPHTDKDGKKPSRDVIEKAVEALSQTNYPANYVLDVGNLKDGTVALVEFNDAYSVGAYPGVDRTVYAKMIAGRWAEFVTA